MDRGKKVGEGWLGKGGGVRGQGGGIYILVKFSTKQLQH